jgi:hypothetical protein
MTNGIRPALSGVLVLILLVLALGFGVWGLGFGLSPVLPTPTAWPRVRLASPEYGLQASLWWDKEPARRDLQLIHDAGFTWVKQHVGWRDIEGILKGHYDWYFTDRIVADAEQFGLNVLFRLDREPVWAVASRGTTSYSGPPEDPQDFGDFCHALAD